MERKRSVAVPKWAHPDLGRHLPTPTSICSIVGLRRVDNSIKGVARKLDLTSQAYRRMPRSAPTGQARNTPIIACKTLQSPVSM